MIDVVAELKEKQLIEDDEGRLIMWPKSKTGADTATGTGTETGEGQVPLIVQKSDGGNTYDTSDMAAIRYRLLDLQAHWVIYVIDAGQSVHMQGIFGGAERAGWLNRNVRRLDHVGFGVVLGEDGKKLRSRNPKETLRLKDLLDEGLTRTHTRLKEKIRAKDLSEEEFRSIQEAIAYGCIKYSDLSHNRNAEYQFSFDKMLDDKGNTAVYLLYAYARIKSIARTGSIDLVQLREQARSIPLEGAGGGEQVCAARLVQAPQEWRLCKHLVRLPEVLHRVLEDLCPHSICDFLYELATRFTEFYDHCYCIEKDRNSGEIVKINTERIMLCEATAAVMRTCFEILGIRPVERM